MTSNRDTRRRFEQWASNPRCVANTVSAVRNVRMVEVAERAGVRPTFGASPFALGRGEQFERDLLDDGAARLIDAMSRAEALDPTLSGFVDLRTRENGGSDRSISGLDHAISRTSELLGRIGSAQGDDLFELPALVAAATLRIPRGVMLPEAVLIIDVMTVSIVDTDDGPRAMVAVGEIKTYPDRGGETDRGQLAQARAQLGLYLHALEVVSASMPPQERFLASEFGFLVMTRPGTNFPSIRVGEHLRHQADRAARGFDRLEQVAAALDPRTTDDIEAVLRAETHYCEACLEFCDLAERCHQRALQTHDPSVLGDAMSDFLGHIDLRRAVDLLEGSPPSGPREAEMIERLRAAEEPGWE